MDNYCLNNIIVFSICFTSYRKRKLLILLYIDKICLVQLIGLSFLCNIVDSSESFRDLGKVGRTIIFFFFFSSQQSPLTGELILTSYLRTLAFYEHRTEGIIGLTVILSNLLVSSTDPSKLGKSSFFENSKGIFY